jgi:aryl-alcohol dehydrogenase-like predicted oxidoreductase
MEIRRTDYKPLGKTDIMVSPVMLGTMEFDKSFYKDSDDSEAIEIIRTAIDRGVNFFDSAEAYGDGHSEKVLGEAVRQSGKDVIIVSKLATWDGELTEARIRTSLENSLRRLQRDYLDLYMIHWPTKSVSMKWVMELLMKFKAEGKIKAAGVSNFSVEEMEFAGQGGEIEALQSPYSAVWRCLERNALPYCLEKGISVMTYSPLGQGILSGAFARDRRPQQLTQPQTTYYLYKEPYYSMCMDVVDAIAEICRAKGYKAAQVALAWLLSRKAVTSVLIGIEKKEQLIENLGALDIKLTPEEIQKIEAAGTAMLDAIDATMAKSMTGWWPDKEGG